MYQKTPIKLNVIFYNHSVVSTFKQVTKTTTMSSPITKNVSAQTKTPTPQKKAVAKKDAADKPPAKPRKPTLKEKHSRFLVSNYSLIQFLSAKGLLTDEGVETAYSEIKMFATLEDQEAFYESYLSESKTTKKTMKKFITQRNKPPKAPRAKKEREPKKETAPKEKKPRAKKTTKVANDTEVDVVSQVAATEGAENLINELTAAANNASSPIGVQQQVTPEPLVQEVEPTAPQKKARKPRAKKVEAIPIALADTAAAESEVAPKEKKPRAKKVKAEEDPPKEKKPRAKKAKKEDVVVEAPAPTVQEELVAEEEEEEIHTQEITINGTLYLIDNDNNLYSSDTHEQVGTYNTEANEVEATA